jgi:hypothetical protein
MIIRIQVKETRNGRYEARMGSTLVCTSRTPFLASARELLRLGFEEDDTLEMVRESGRVDMRGRLGKASLLAVEEGQRRGPLFVKYREMQMSNPDGDMRW